MKKLVFVSLVCILGFRARASHIVGGELYYDCLGNNQYKITLKLYRDCYCTNCAQYGNPEYLAIFNSSGNLVQQPAMFFPGSNHLNPTFTNTCMTQPDVCVEEADYTTTVTLPPLAGGYNIVYQRCCRNDGVSNLVQGEGATYLIHIPDPALAQCNSSPRFNNLPPMYICVNAPLSIDYSATDPNGDQLVYSLCNPDNGADGNCPDPSPNSTGSGCPTAPSTPPYQANDYVSPYNASNFTNNPSNANNLTIDPQTGLLTGIPNVEGLYDVTVCVSEYRAGQLLSTLRRDFQFTVTQCNIPIASVPQIGLSHGIGIYAIQCKNYTVNFTNNTYNPPPLTNPLWFHWDFGVAGSTTDTSNLPNPTFTYPDTGAYLVTLVALKQESSGQICTDTTTALVYVYPTFSGDFTSVSNCPDSLLSFTDLSASNTGSAPTQWYWNFGDGGTATQQNPTHAFSTPGNHSVMLIATDSRGCRDTVIKDAVVYDLPNIDAGPDTSVCVNPLHYQDSVQLQATGGVSYRWSPPTSLSATNIANPLSKPSSTITYYVTGTDAHGCKNTDSVTVYKLDPNINLILEDTMSICPSDTAYPTVVSQTASQYFWFPLQYLTNPTSGNTGFYPPVTTRYILTIANYCYTKSDSITIQTLPVPQLGLPDLDSVCLGNPFQLQANDAAIYQWRTDATLSSDTIANPVATPVFTERYYVTGIGADGCVSSDSELVLVYQPSVITVTPRLTHVCIGSNVQLTAAGGYLYAWTPAASLSNANVANPLASPTTNTVYVVTATNIHGCSSYDSAVVTVEFPVTAVAQSPYNVCVGTPVELFSSGGEYYSWSPVENINNPYTNDPFVTPDSTTTYVVTVGNDCFSDSAFVQVIVHQLPVVDAGADTTIWRGTFVYLHGTTPATNYFWNTSAYITNAFSLNTTALPSQTTWYTLFATDAFGCLNTDSVLVTVVEHDILDIPTAFSPNGDGVNDVFHIVRSLGIEHLIDFSVYNRWGQKVFATDNINTGWDGTAEGQPAPLGVYVWMVVAQNGDGKEFVRKGNVTLIR
ncbi:MAG TPA: PKD domain-containing protein [Chitinophagales bacterium]|nr:PKD domain-containing protein [Chitinophagales bacterium]